MKHQNQKRAKRVLCGAAGATIAALGLAASVFAATPAVAAAGTEGAPAVAAAATPEVRNVFLGVGKSESERCLSWLSTSADAGSVQYAVAPAGFKAGDAFPAEGAVSVKATVADAQRAGFHSNKATIKGLRPETSYVYRVGNDAAWSDPIVFSTGKLGAGEEFNFLVAGDPQIGAGSYDKDSAGWKNMLDACQQKFPGTDFLFSMGDQVNNYDGSKADREYDAYMAPNAIRTMGNAVEVGNHDEGNHEQANSRYTDYFTNPGCSNLGKTQGAGANSGDYWFKYNGVLFMSLNSNDTSTARHKEFIENALAVNPDAVWSVASFHHATYSVASHNTDGDIVKRREELSPVFSELGVDVVLMGHDHYYTRTYLMDGTNPVIPEGQDVSKGQKAPSEGVAEEGQVLYLTADSASGSKYYKKNAQFGEGLPNWSAMSWQGQAPSITNITADADSMTFETYSQGEDGSLSLIDSYTLTKADESDPELEQHRAELQDAVEGVKQENLDPKDYQADAWAVFCAALDEADAVLADSDATDEQVQAALAKLKKARASLDEHGSESGNSNGGQGNSNGDGQGNNNGGQGNNSGDGQGNNNGGQGNAPAAGAPDKKPSSASSTSGPAKASGSALPQTGDGSMFTVAGVAVIGIAVVAGAEYLRRREA